MVEVQVSIEEHINSFLNNDMTIQELLALTPTLTNQGDHSSTNNTCVPCNEMDLINPQDCDIGKDDLDIYLPKFGNSKGNIFDPSNYLAIDNNMQKVFEHDTRTNPQLSLKSNYVMLSSSVGVTMPKKFERTSSAIQISDLEQDYKARYKSDYFSQDGKVRPPRYVADRSGNHFVSIKFAPGTKGHIRIDWVTIPNKQNARFSMPYKFQVNNDFLEVPDENPTHKPIDADNSGLMRAYLVLIKSKQSELAKLQPLRLFPPGLETFNKDHLNEMTPLPPKQLIQKYQLDQSQLAFTYCTLDPSGTAYIPDWSTTVYSTIMTEKPDELLKKRKITCPQCSHSFQITLDAVDDVVLEGVLKKRKA